MPSFDSTGVAINYVAEGEGPPVILVHGFASSLQGNWRTTGVIDAITEAGREVVALDCRGHGSSAKPHDSQAYEGTAMADDVTALMDYLGIGRADLIGYSMGGFIAASLLVRRPERFRSVILAGVGDRRMLNDTSDRAGEIAQAMEAPEKNAVKEASARAFREFAERSGNDLRALAAMQRGSSKRRWFDPAKFGEVRIPVMVLVGEADTLVGPPDGLAAAIPGSKLVRVPGDHLSAPGMPEFKAAVLEFLAQHSPLAAV
jgi:pimeloyl-ACP methyl ester carboxylesterase